MAEARAAEVLLKALEQDNADIGEYPRAYLLWLARDLAAALNSGGALGGSFASRVRTVCANLPRPHNWALRTRFCSREVSVDEICAMDADAWASAQQREQKKEGHQRRLRQRTVCLFLPHAHLRRLTPFHRS